ncbi:hypothetical protein V6N13_008974 [Hibiscus sabdariffa]
MFNNGFEINRNYASNDKVTVSLRTKPDVEQDAIPEDLIMLDAEPDAILEAFIMTSLSECSSKHCRIAVASFDDLIHSSSNATW